MNTSGVTRGYLSKNLNEKEFIKVVIKALSTEFEKEFRLEIVGHNEFKISLGDYSVIMSKDLIKKLKSPYGIDRFILEKFEDQGFKFDRNRSQYIQYCFGIFNQDN